MNLTQVLSLLSGVALFLFGMLLIGDNLKKVAGSKLEIILYRLSSTPLKGILLGTAVTSVIQSSCATSVMTVGFVNSKMMKVRQAIYVIAGSIIGTSITGWVICLSEIGGNSAGWLSLFSTQNLSALVAVVGIVLRMFSKKQLRRNIGEIMLGFAVLMFGISTMSGSVSGLKESAAFISLMTAFQNPLLGILVGIVFTSILQSASAAVGILQALSATGVITFDVSFSLILGIAIGAAIPVLLSAIGSSTDGKRAAVSYLIIVSIGVALFSVIFYSVNAFVHFSFMNKIMNMFSIALLNTVLRVITIAITVPFVGLIEKICCFIFKEDPEEEADLLDIYRLEERFLVHPAVALEQCRLTVNSMAVKTGENLTRALSLLGNYTDQDFAAVEKLEGVVDTYEDKIGAYLVKISGSETDELQSKTISKYLHAITDFERMSDHALNLAENAREIAEKKIKFSPSAEHELNVLISAVGEVIRLARESFVGDNGSLAYRIEPLEDHIDNLCDEIKVHHIERVESGTCTLQHGFVFNDLLTNLERIADHCSNIGVAMIEFENDISGAHEYIENLKEKHTEAYNRYYSSYTQQFHLE